MKCIKCQESFTHTSVLNESNRYGRKYKVLTHNLLDSLENYCYSILDNRPQIPQDLIDNAHKIMVEERGFELKTS